MEFNFDDSIFDDDESIQKSEDQIDTSNWSVKICEEKWFTSAYSEDDLEQMRIINCQGDDLYHSGKYSEALAKYQDVIVLLPDHNNVMRKELQENIARCLLRLDDGNQALKLTDAAFQKKQSPEQKTNRLLLMKKIYKHTHNLLDELLTTQKLLNLHSSSYQLWIDLADLYTRVGVEKKPRLSPQSSVPSSTPATQDNPAKQIPTSKSLTNSTCGVSKDACKTISMVASTCQNPSLGASNFQLNNCEDYETMPAGGVPCGVNARCSESIGCCGDHSGHCSKQYRHKIVTCLICAKMCIRSCYYQTSSFIRTRVNALGKKVEEDLQKYDVSDDEATAITEYLITTLFKKGDTVRVLIREEEEDFMDRFESLCFSWRRLDHINH